MQRIIIPLAIVFLTSAVSAETYSELRRRPLQGIEAVYVVVEDMTAAATAAGLSRSALQTLAELKFRSNGIRVLSEGQWLLERPTHPYVYIDIVALETAYRGFWAYRLDVTVNEAVRLERDRTIRCLAATWDEDGIGRVGQNNLPEEVKARLGDALDMLINDILAARQMKLTSPTEATTPDQTPLGAYVDELRRQVDTMRKKGGDATGSMDESKGK